MSQINKLLILIFSLLLIVVIAEIGYLTLYNPTKSVCESTPIITKTPLTNMSNINQVCFPISSKKESVINEILLESLKKIEKDNFLSSVLTNQYQGKIIDLDIEGGKAPIDKTKYPEAKKDFYDYKIKLIIKNDDASDTLDFYFSEDILLSKVKFIENSNQQEKIIQASSLKINDEVIINETIDLTTKNCFGFACIKEFKIIKK